MAEFCDPKTFRILVSNKNGDYLEYTLEQLLPGAFTPEELEKGQIL